MGNVEAQMLAYLKQRLAEGALAVAEPEMMEAIVPPEHPEWRLRPAYKYGLERLRRRHEINAIDDKRGVCHYFIGNYASKELRAALGL